MVVKLTFNTKALSQRKYTQLLIVLVFTFLLDPFLHGGFGDLLSSALLAYAILLVVGTFSLIHKFFRIYPGLVALAFTLECIFRIGWHQLGSILPFSVLVQAIYATYLGMAAFLILRDILLRQRITVDTIRGGICVYFLIGFVWALLYGIVSSFDARAFSQPLVADSTYDRPIYFSFVTLTTLGYGDIVPISPLAEMLVTLEAIVGQLYPSILIAILVSGYVSQRSQ